MLHARPAKVNGRVPRLRSRDYRPPAPGEASRLQRARPGAGERAGRGAAGPSRGRRLLTHPQTRGRGNLKEGEGAWGVRVLPAASAEYSPDPSSWSVAFAPP